MGSKLLKEIEAFRARLRKGFADSGTPQEFIDDILQARRLPDEYLFEPLTNKFSDGSPARTQWLPAYLRERESGRLAGIDGIREYLRDNEQDASQIAARYRGCLLGLAIGDALGTTNEFKPRESVEPIDDMVGGGPYGLKPGYWTDDTSMALCLAHSLLRKRGFDAEDQIELYVVWWKEGAFSSIGTCFDIGNTVRGALESYLATGEAYAGSSDPQSAGNGSLMRLAPVPMFYRDPRDAIYYSGESSKVTHGATEAVDACRYYGALIHGALHGASKGELLDGLYAPEPGCWDDAPLCETVRAIAEGSFKRKSRDEIRSSGYVIHSLEAALWAFQHSDDFREGALKAVNLGEDADTVGAIYGQLAGAYYGEWDLPPRWTRRTQRFHVFYGKADDLLAAHADRK